MLLAKFGVITVRTKVYLKGACDDIGGYNGMIESVYTLFIVYIKGACDDIGSYNLVH
jgi:hypothetical protein